ncbi:hypothetical protein [Niveispirillum sp. KHB5.9]|uniref:hypothetical protein n=1 Tax=Niveispirillum sp. KHB5.9 TaxID=3400269 RepID=UPI003A898BB5
MTKREFLDLLDRYGADPARWPAPLRLRADRALATDADLQALWQAEIVLEDALAGLPETIAGPELRRSVLDIPLDHPRGAITPSLTRLLIEGWRRWTAGMATVTAAGLIGFVLGYGQLVEPPAASAGEQTGVEELASLLGDTTYDEAVDLENAE